MIKIFEVIKSINAVKLSRASDAALDGRFLYPHRPSAWMTPRRLLLSATLLVGSLAIPTASPAQATTATTTIAVSALVLSFCTIVALPLTFGNYTSALISTSSSVTVTCSNGTTYNVGLDVGSGTGASVATRKMTFGTSLLNYVLYSDVAHTTLWGPTPGTNTVAGTATGLPQVIPVYGQIPASQTVAAGTYLDTVTATV